MRGLLALVLCVLLAACSAKDGGDSCNHGQPEVPIVPTLY